MLREPQRQTNPHERLDVLIGLPAQVDHAHLSNKSEHACQRINCSLMQHG